MRWECRLGFAHFIWPHVSLSLSDQGVLQDCSRIAPGLLWDCSGIAPARSLIAPGTHHPAPGTIWAAQGAKSSTESGWKRKGKSRGFRRKHLLYISRKSALSDANFLIGHVCTPRPNVSSRKDIKQPASTSSLHRTSKTLSEQEVFAVLLRARWPVRLALIF